VVADIDEDSERQQGIFHAVSYLRSQGRLDPHELDPHELDPHELDPHEKEQHDSISRWFNENLKKPTRFTASKPPHYRKKSKAISWFKDSASAHIAQARELVAIPSASQCFGSDAEVEPSWLYRLRGRTSNRG
jgi:hypothetical protein